MKAMMKVGTDPDKKPSYGQQSTHSRVIKRNKKGTLDEGESSISSTTIYADDNKRKAQAQPGTGSFDGSAAPRVGGGTPLQKSSPVVGGTKKQMRFAKTNVRKNSASPQAKRSALKLYK